MKIILIVMLESVLKAYGFDRSSVIAEEFGKGLINSTWKINCQNKNYILQLVNSSVFTKPGQIDDNINQIANHLTKNHPDYFFVRPVQTVAGSTLHINEEGYYFRMFPFVEGSHTIDVVQNTKQAYEAAAQFGKFTNMLQGFRASDLKMSIPAFHDLSLRYKQFQKALAAGNVKRVRECRELISTLETFAYILNEYRWAVDHPAFKKRVTHHDTKISNVLFGQQDQGLCVIDLDTVMPGYFFSDVGDMMRTYLSPVSEEVKEFDKIEIREEFYYAIVSGYGEQMRDELSEIEKSFFFFSGEFMIYMQALRFLTDYLNDDEYYGARYEGHNFIRAKNQLVLLEKFHEKEKIFKRKTHLV